MKEKILNFTFCLFCFMSIILIFKHNKEVANVIINATNLFLKKVLVSLFPMFIINDILIHLDIPYYFYKIFNQLFIKLFHINGLGAYVFIMSLISGTPSNAYILKELVLNNKLSKEEASHFNSNAIHNLFFKNNLKNYYNPLYIQSYNRISNKKESPNNY